MRRFVIASGFVIASVANAEVVTLECNGTNAAGAKETVTVQFDETAGWVNDNGVISISDGVKADSLFGFKVIVDRRTGEYKTNRPHSPDESYKGTCEKMEKKF